MFHATTILCVHREGKVAIGGDGQVSVGNTIFKKGAVKIRTLADGKVVAGFAGSSADAFTLFERFEGKLQEHRGGGLLRAAVELAKDWRTDRVLRKLEAMMIVADKEKVLTISGTGDVIEPDDGIATIGSGGSYACAAARALVQETRLKPREVVEKAMHIAAEICIYTNDSISILEL